MLYLTQKGESFGTGEERGGIEALAKGFLLPGAPRSAETAALEGWGDSGPLQESRNLQVLTRDLEEQVARRLLAAKQGQE